MDPKRVDEIYSLLPTFSVDLSADAWSLGPKYIHELISRTRGYINTVSFYLQEILQERQSLDRAKHANEAAFRVESDRLLSEYDRCRILPNIDARKATVNLILRDQLSEISRLDGLLLDLSYVEKAVRHRYQELKATMTDIRAQRALIRDAIDSGSFYGDETATSRGGTSPGASISEDEVDQTMAELNDMLLQESEGLSAAAAKPEAPKDEPPAPKPSVDDFSDVLEEASLPVTSAEEPQKANGSVEDPDINRFLEGDDDLSNLFADDEALV